MQKVIVILFVLARVAAAMVGLSILAGSLFFGYRGSNAELLELLTGVAAVAIAMLFVLPSLATQRLVWVICLGVVAAYTVMRGTERSVFGSSVFILPGVLLLCLVVLAFSMKKPGV